VSDDEVRQIVVHPVVWPHLVQWFDSKGLTIVMLNEASEEDLETWFISLTGS